MTKLNAVPSAAIALSASLALTACGGTVDFSVDEMIDVDSNVNSGSTLVTVDLAAEAGQAWKHRDKISSVTVETAEVSVAAIDPANVATQISGSVWLLPEGATTAADPGAVFLGTWTNEAVVVGNSVVLTPTAELNAFVENTFNGSGRFGILASGEGASGARLACTLRVVLGAKLKWETF
jgi:hypothetical protein